MAHPGALPTLNYEAIKSVVLAGLAVGGTIADYSEFDRKNYFYPDIPKGYQISQYKYPIVTGGSVAGVALTRIHLEEDTGSSQHAKDRTLVDFNRAGVPLMELVTEPVIHSSTDAMRFGRELQLLFRYLDISDANMEMGQMRVEANISLSPEQSKFGTKVEVKNLNSFSAVGRAIEYELARMEALYESGRESEIVQETRGWDDIKGETRSQRIKENSAEYRYFPDPDLPKLLLHTLFDLNTLRTELPELPDEKRKRYTDTYGIKSDDIEFFMYNSIYAALFESVMIGLPRTHAQSASNYICSDLVGLCGEFGETVVLQRIDATRIIELVQMVVAGELGSRAAKDILRIMATEGGMPKSLASERGLTQKNDTDTLAKFVNQVIVDHPAVVAEYRSGKVAVMMFLVGQVMKLSKGSANPEVVKTMLEQVLAA
jgi:aspartyl-tRNA(Asn)/glutamyl-tRNA(Gln) amidotransferase subunit B